MYIYIFQATSEEKINYDFNKQL